jgi:hypothetical protein
MLVMHHQHTDKLILTHGHYCFALLIQHTHLTANTRIPERSNLVLGYGYSAMYLYNSTQKYQLMASVTRLHNGSFAVDDPLHSTGWLEALRTSKTWLLDDHETVTTDQTIHGVKYVLSARCINKNARYDNLGTDVDPVGFDGELTRDCIGFLIQGMPWALVKNTLAGGYAWQVR